MPPAKSLCQCLFKILSAGFIFLPHFYCLPRPKFLRSESFFFSALSSQTLLLIKQINIWSRGVSTRTQPSQPGDLSDQQSWIQLESLGERNYLSSDKIFLTLWNKFQLENTVQIWHLWGMENTQLWLISWLSHFSSLTLLLECFFRGNLWGAEVLFSVKCWDHRACDLFFFFLFFSFGLKAEREDKPWRRRSAMKLFRTHTNTHFRS